MARDMAQKIVIGQIIKERKRKILGDKASAKRLKVTTKEINTTTGIDFNNPLLSEKINVEMERILSQSKEIKKAQLGNFFV